MSKALLSLVFDAADFRATCEELLLRLKAFGSLENVPPHIRSKIEDALVGKGYSFHCLKTGTTGKAGERVLKIQLGGVLHEALSTLRAEQGDIVFLGHEGLPSRESTGGTVESTRGEDPS